MKLNLLLALCCTAALVRAQDGSSQPPAPEIVCDNPFDQEESASRASQGASIPVWRTHSMILEESGQHGRRSESF